METEEVFEWFKSSLDQNVESLESGLVSQTKKIQIIINLADKSEASWLAVKEYQTKELASNSEDEKRIKKVQERALK